MKKPSASKVIDRLLKQNQKLRYALLLLYEETADYIQINHLGSVHHNQSMKRARAVLRLSQL
jgi:hypothetical protein